MENDQMLADLLERNSSLFTIYESWANTQVKVMTGTINDPASFDKDGGKSGPLGYYPVTNVNGQTVYVPCLARLYATAPIEEITEAFADAIADEATNRTLAINNRFRMADGRFEVTTIGMQKPVISDLKGGSGGPRVFLPKAPIHINAPRLGLNVVINPVGAESTEIPGYIKFDLPTSDFNVSTQFYLDANTATFLKAASPDTPAATNGIIAMISVFGGEVTAFEGVKLISYDEWKTGTQGWTDVSAIDAEIIDDEYGVWGGGRAWYLKKYFFNARGFVDALFTINNPTSTEMPGFIKIPKDPNGNLQQIAFNTATGYFESYGYAILKTTFAQAGASVVPIFRSIKGKMHTDFPVRKTIEMDMPIAGPHLFLVEGRPLPFYPQALYADRQDVRNRVTSIDSDAMDGRGCSPICAATHWLRAEDFGATATIVCRTNSVDAPDKQRRSTISLTVMKGPPQGSGSFTAMLFGDSLTDFDATDHFANGVMSLSYAAPNMVGTLATGGSSIFKDEGRAGWQAADFTHENNRYPGIEDTPAAWAAYMAMSDYEKHQRNPFIRRATAFDPPDRKFIGLDGNYWVFDFQFYLTRAGFPPIDHFRYNLGTNDNYIDGLTVQQAAALIVRSTNTILDSVRAANANTHIYISQIGYGRVADQDDRWATRVRQAQLSTLIDVYFYRKATGDARLWFVSAFLHQNPESNYATNETGSDPKTKTKTCMIYDGLHPIGVGRSQIADAEIAAVHACQNLGYAGVKDAPLLASLKSVGLRPTVGSVSAWQMAEALANDGSLQTVIDFLPANPTSPVRRRWDRNSPIAAGDPLATFIATSTGKNPAAMAALFAAAAAI